MREKAVGKYSYALEYVSARCKNQEMCKRVVLKYPGTLKYVPDQYITQDTCERSAKRGHKHWF